AEVKEIWSKIRLKDSNERNFRWRYHVPPLVKPPKTPEFKLLGFDAGARVSGGGKAKTLTIKSQDGEIFLRLLLRQPGVSNHGRGSYREIWLHIILEDESRKALLLSDKVQAKFIRLRRRTDKWEAHITVEKEVSFEKPRVIYGIDIGMKDALLFCVPIFIDSQETTETASEGKKLIVVEAGQFWHRLEVEDAQWRKWQFRRSGKAKEGIKNCADIGLMTCVATTVTKYNYNEIPKLIDLSIELGAKRFIAFNFIPTGRGKDIVKYDITPLQREKLLNFLYDKLDEGKIEVFSTAPQFARTALERIKRGKRGKIAVTHFAAIPLEGKEITLAKFIGGCGAGRLYCAIEPNGDIQPCVFIPIKIGNIKEGFEKVWHSSPILEQLRDRSKLKNHCGECDYKFVCGGCRARAYAYLNDLNAPDIGCIYNSL
ncbi:MAG: SPASM domain-containing protein, partial [Candidatus Aenigmatarchaeota archaeon]